ncbi:hypothetical protein [Geomonas oryzae]|uniref:hypothetical protein n=1 Tax=Geomonas oryzae TaxID=2364273 RepID=UPI00100BCF62|nr:hypothetical protein [Geomonas oryzae]
MKQRIGNINGSKNVIVTQASTLSQGTTSSEQDVGAITNTEGVRIAQILCNDEVLVDALGMGASLSREVASLSKSEAASLARDTVALVEDLLAEPLSLKQVTVSLNAIKEQEDIPSVLRHTFRDLATMISAVSGSVALWQVGDPATVAIGIPAMLGVTGLLAGDKLREIYLRISRRIREGQRR